MPEHILEKANWQLQKDENQIAWLYFDKKDAKANTIDHNVLEELAQILAFLESEQELKGLIISSLKKSGFCLGADIQQFYEKGSKEDIKSLISKGHAVFEQLAHFTKPTVAVIDGFCLGGGLELALACQYRISTTNFKKCLGLPEILLGIIPGWGGTVRLPKLIGAKDALPLILQGRLINPKVALKLGLINAVVPLRQLKKAAIYYVLERPAKAELNAQKAIFNTSFMRPLLAKMLEYKTKQKISPEHYPAPFTVIENWRRFGLKEPEAMDAEQNSILHLIETPTAQNLFRVFFLRERLKNLAKNIEFSAQHVHVVGAGIMGGDIAAWCALRGFKVSLQDREAKILAPAMKRAYQLFKDKLKEKRLIQEAMDRLIPDVEGNSLGQADVIIEAIIEDLSAKQALFKDIELKAKPNALIATNTSSIPLTEISKALKNPERLVGIHFFNPVAKMQLVEIVHAENTSKDILEKAEAFISKIDRLPLAVKSSPGFLVNRVLMPYLMEAFRLFEEGVPLDIIDKAATNFGMPMGPIELADTVGLDICLSVANNLTQHYGGEIPEKLKKMVQDGHLGKKKGQGFYRYLNNRAKKSYNLLSPDLTDRLILRMVNEAMACLREQIVTDGDLLDAGMIFGTGFAPFRGGPIHYACQTGLVNLKQRLEELATKYGERFNPDPEWDVKIEHE